MTDLKPCGHCGATSPVHLERYRKNPEMNIYVVCDALKGGCGASSGSRRTEIEAVEARNTRHRETCEDVSTKDGFFKCSECGCAVDENGVDFGGINFCPDCGKAVD